MASPNTQYDVIVIGGGINGLTCGAYMQKAGFKTAIFERRDESGTFCSTEETLYPGVKLNMHASMLMLHFGPAYLDLELERFGLELLRAPGSRFAYFHPFLDGNAVMFSGRSAAETYEAWKMISAKDAETYRKIVNFFGSQRGLLMSGEMGTRPTHESFLAFADSANLIPVLPKDWLWMTGVELADCLFENEQIKLGLLS